jgi:hypothetical protein
MAKYHSPEHHSTDFGIEEPSSPQLCRAILVWNGSLTTSPAILPIAPTFEQADQIRNLVESKFKVQADE